MKKRTSKKKKDAELRKRVEKRLKSVVPSLEKMSNVDIKRLIHELEMQNEELRQYEHIISSSTDMLAFMDKKFIYVAANPAYLEAFKKTREELIGQTVSEVFGEKFFDTVIKPNAERCLTGKEVNYQSWFKFPSLGQRYMDITYYPHANADNEVIGFIVNGRDITERRQADEQIRKLSHAVEYSSATVVITDNKGKIEYVNPKFTQLTGYTFEKALGQNPRIMKSGKTPPKEYKRLWKTILSGVEWRGEFCNKKKNGELYWESASISPIKNAEGAITHFVAVKEDITERKQVEAKIKHIAFHDPLTDLPNRLLFNDRLNLAIAHAHRNKERLAVLFLDLDRFKVINDTVGHALGDQLLQDIADRLKNCIRGDDTIARFGGDEFNLLLPGINHVEDVHNITRKIVKTLKQPLVIGNREFYSTASIGVSIYPHDGEDSETLLKHADMAMYRAKEHGRNNYHFYSTSIHAKSFEKMITENDLLRAVKRKEFEVYYQPQVNINTGYIIGVEALMRWHYPNRGMLFPGEFLHLAEDTRLIVNIDKLILHSVCVQNKAWQDKGFQALCVSVNLSAHTFQKIDLIETVTSVLKKTDIDPHSLMLEIPESIAMQNLDSTIHKLEKLCDLGIKIAIDDFGTGFSSLYYLKKFPINKLKISQHFIRDIVTDQNDKVIVSLVIDLAQSLKLKVIAEGVETSQQLSFLKQRQCDEMQGYLFSKPVPAEKFEEMLVHDKRLHS